MTSNRQDDLSSGNESQGVGKSKWAAYLLLLGLSTLSAWAIWSIPPMVPSGPGDIGVFAILMQWLFVIPATLIVFFVYSGLSRLSLKQVYRINPVVRVGLPLLFNILAAGSFFISFIPVWYEDLSGNISASMLSRSLTLMIKEENIVPGASKFDNPIYHAVLHAENNSGQEISLYFSLGDYETAVYQEDSRAHDLGPDSTLSRIPPGDSDLIIDVPIYDYIVFCNNDLLAKPIHLLYRLQDSTQHQGGFSLGKSINKRLQELGCAAAP